MRDAGCAMRDSLISYLVSRTSYLVSRIADHDSRFSEKALQEYDVEPSVELAADLLEVGDAGKP